MECVKREAAVKHAQSPQCVVYEYPMQTSEMNIAVAEVKGRYPEQGYALNHACSEMGYVIKGNGKLIT